MIDAVSDVFGIRVAHDPNGLESPRRLVLGIDAPPIYVDTDDLQLLAWIRRFAVREIASTAARELAETRLADLQEKTSNLIPGGSDDKSGLSEWKIEQDPLSLLQRYTGFATSVDGTVVRCNNLNRADLTSTLEVLKREGERSVPAGNGALFGCRHGSVCVVVYSASELDSTDHELVHLQAMWLNRMLIEQRNLLHLDDLAAKLTTANAELSAAVARAEEAAQTKAAFLANMSHELRTPLNGIMGIAQLLDETPLTPDQRSMLDVQLESSGWLRDIIDAVLDLSKLDADAMELELVAFDVHELVRGVLRGVQPQAASKGLSLHSTIDIDVPQFVAGDPTRIRQALLNLLSNAIKFTPTGSVRVNVHAAPDEQLEFQVVDQGIGIAADRWNAIFEPFVQADESTTRTYGGTGLGLPLVRSFARLHGGDASVTSKPGVGSTFTFTAILPSTVEPDRKEREVPINEPRAMRILVVEDQAINQLIVQRMLTGRGHEVCIESDGQCALDRLASDSAFDLVLLDCMMPVLNGWDTVSRIRTLAAPIAQLNVVALTASATPEERKRCLAAGMDDVLLKPLDRDQLVRVLHRALDGSLRAA